MFVIFLCYEYIKYIYEFIICAMLHIIKLSKNILAKRIHNSLNISKNEYENTAVLKCEI